jgi:O-methyltransferase
VKGRFQTEARRLLAHGRIAGRDLRGGAWLLPSVRRVLPYTMLRTPTLLSLGRHTLNQLSMPGAFVECGVWRGGASFLMADVLRRRGDTRTVWMFDSFEGMPATEPIDGSKALAWETQGDPATNDATATLREVEDARRRLGLLNTRPVKGWFEDTLATTKDDIGPIALLRIDCDWHASVTTCLAELYERVVPGGVVIVDDYYTFEGCAIAVHEYLGVNRLPHRIGRDRGTAVIELPG